MAKSASIETAQVGIVMGSTSDWPTLEHAAATLATLEVPCETRVVSAHRTPDLLFEYAESAAERGLRVIIAGAGGAAHLPGMLASVGTLAIGKSGAINAALLAAAILATTDAPLAKRLELWRASQTAAVLKNPDPSKGSAESSDSSDSSR
jgi:5-(carboxyamino)imidazole ribonucleotide mutase